jgi:XRE family aerobic/anaerobic benzoate catabolism transcriptional regulator
MRTEFVSFEILRLRPPTLPPGSGHAQPARGSSASARARRPEPSGRSGLSLRFLLDVEAGRGNISVRRLADLATALHTTAADLVTAHAEDPQPEVIALLGLRGAGKTTIGRRLARRLKRRFVELDHLIEQRAGLTLGEISLHGEEYYRRIGRRRRDRLRPAPVDGQPSAAGW